MKVEIKYAQGDLVKYVKAKRVHSAICCSFCGGVGQIEGKDGTKATCPICDGIGFKIGTTVQGEVTEGKIQDILIKYRGIEEEDYSNLQVIYRMSDLAETIVSQDKIIAKIGHSRNF